MRDSYKRARRARRKRHKRQKRRSRRAERHARRSARVLPTDSGGWRASLQNAGGVVGGFAGFIELIILLVAL